MPTTSAAAKALRQNTKARQHNRQIKERLKKLSVQLRKAYAAKNVASAKTLTAELLRAYDRAAQKRVIHRNTAGRKKSRLAAQLRAAA